METPIRILPLLALALALLAPHAGAQQAAEPALQPGVWRLAVQDRNPNRELEILRVQPAEGGKAAVQARYGWWGGSLGKVAATLDQTDGPARLEFTTKAQSRVRLQKVDDTTFDGTLENNRGRSFAARLKLVSTQADGEAGAGVASEAAEESPPPAQSSGKVAYPPGAKIHFVYMGGNDCPPCREWRATEFKKLEAAPEFAQMKFHYVVKSVPSPVPVGWLPDELKPYGASMLEASAGRGGSSQNAFIVDGKIADYWFGARDASEIVAMIRAVREGRPLPGRPCLKRNLARQCEVRG